MSAKGSNERGVTIVELSVVLFLMSVVGLLFFNLFAGTLRTTMMLESRADLTTLGQRSVNDVRSELMQSRTVFQNDALGQSYLGALTLPTGVGPIPKSKLPIVDANGIIEPEAAGENFVGNTLLLTRQLQSEEIPVDHDGDAGTPQIGFLCDVYEFQYYFLLERNDRDFAGTGGYLDLVLARSGSYADFFQLSGLDAAVRSQLNTALIARGITSAWNPGQPAGSAFYTLVNDGTLTGPNGSHKIDVSNDVVSLLPEFKGGRISGKMTYTVAPNSVSTTSGNVQTFVMAQRDVEFPSGFETLIVGHSGSRKIFLRLALMSEHAGAISAHANEVIIANADF